MVVRFIRYHPPPKKHPSIWHSPDPVGIFRLPRQLSHPHRRLRPRTTPVLAPRPSHHLVGIPHYPAYPLRKQPLLLEYARPTISTKHHPLPWPPKPHTFP